MDPEFLNEGVNLSEPQQSDKNSDIKTSDVYNVNSNLPQRFNHPQCFSGYSKKTAHPLYRTTNQTYGSKKPTVHEMPTAFHGSCRKFSEHLLKSGMYRDKGFNTTLEKNRITGPNTLTIHCDKINFLHSYQAERNNQTESKMA